MILYLLTYLFFQWRRNRCFSHFNDEFSETLVYKKSFINVLWDRRVFHCKTNTWYFLLIMLIICTIYWRWGLYWSVYLTNRFFIIKIGLKLYFLLIKQSCVFFSAYWIRNCLWQFSVTIARITLPLQKCQIWNLIKNFFEMLGCGPKSIFKRSTAVSIRSFFFSYTNFKEPSLFYYVPIPWGRTAGCTPFPKV